MTATHYHHDVVAWANEQSRLLREGKFSLVDIEHVAEEIEEVGRREHRELMSRMSVLLAHLLKWQFQPAMRSASWRATIRAQRKEIALLLKETPSLKPRLGDAEWTDVVWSRAVAIAIAETGMSSFPESMDWAFELVLDEGFWPE